jgi:shikimate dehydrogenase
LGAGGAARACAAGLARSGARVTVVNRTRDKAQHLIDFLKIGWPNSRLSAVTFDLLPKLVDSADLIVNCTPLGMWPNMNDSAWPANLRFPRQAVLYDTIYRPTETKLMQQARAAGARVYGGLGMLVYQGATAFEAWTGRKAPIDVMRKACEEALTATIKSEEH